MMHVLLQELDLQQDADAVADVTAAAHPQALTSSERSTLLQRLPPDVSPPALGAVACLGGTDPDVSSPQVAVSLCTWHALLLPALTCAPVQGCWCFGEHENTNTVVRHLMSIIHLCRHLCRRWKRRQAQLAAGCEGWTRRQSGARCTRSRRYFTLWLYYCGRFFLAPNDARHLADRQDLHASQLFLCGLLHLWFCFC